MGSDLEELAGAASRLAQALAGRPDLGGRSARLAERLCLGRFNVSVLGEFKRGKSTLINALVGRDVMPSGVLPLTSVVTELTYGPPGAIVVKLDGTSDDIELGSLAEYATEALNPGNKKQIARVEARAPCELLRSGVVLVDTPGIGSVFKHDEVAAAALLEADGAILVLSADAPLSDQERRLLRALAERQAPTFFVLNRTDHLSPHERAEVSHFISVAMAQDLGREERLWCLSARAALVSRLSGTKMGVEAGEFGEFLAAFEAFVAHDMVDLRLTTARNELSRLADQLNESLALEAAASELDAATLAAKVSELRSAARREREAFEDERTLLQRHVTKLINDIGQELAQSISARLPGWDRRLVEVAGVTPVRRLEDELRKEVERAVRQGFDEFRQSEADKAEMAWTRLAARFRGRTQQRIDAVRAVAADIFQVELPQSAVPAVAEERERYFYLFLYIGTSTESLDRFLRRLIPPKIARRRLLRRAHKDLVAELDKHAGRSRADLAERLGAVSRRFEAAMAAELDACTTSIVIAAERADELKDLAEADVARRRSEDVVARSAAAAAAALARPRAAQVQTGPSVAGGNRLRR